MTVFDFGKATYLILYRKKQAGISFTSNTVKSWIFNCKFIVICDWKQAIFDHTPFKMAICDLKTACERSCKISPQWFLKIERVWAMSKNSLFISNVLYEVPLIWLALILRFLYDLIGSKIRDIICMKMKVWTHINKDNLRLNILKHASRTIVFSTREFDHLS